MKRAERAAAVVDRLAELYPEAECELDHSSPWQLLVATVLSAQCTDRRVNQVTPELFRRWPDPAGLAAASEEEVAEVIRPTGLFRSKARSLRAAAALVLEKHGGEMPADREALTTLPGVGAKTAKVVLGVAFAKPDGIAVDTHVGRVARRLGLSRQHEAELVAADLERLTPRSEWIRLSLRLVLHGRRVCVARRPRCAECSLEPICPQVGL